MHKQAWINENFECEGKSGYGTHRSAMGAIRHIKRHKNSKEERPIRPYKCRACGKWHITSGKNKRKRFKHEQD